MWGGMHNDAKSKYLKMYALWEIIMVSRMEHLLVTCNRPADNASVPSNQIPFIIYQKEETYEKLKTGLS